MHRAAAVILLVFALSGPALAGPVALHGSYVGEVLGDASGGLRRGAAYEGLATLEADADLASLAGSGAKAYARVYQIHGRGPTEHYVGNLMTVSNIEAQPATRLNSLWAEKAFDGGRISLRAGRMGADEEFFASETAGAFVNSTFGWPLVASEDTAGAAYPFARPGARVGLAPRPGSAVRVAAFDEEGGTLWMGEARHGPWKLGAWRDTSASGGAYAVVDGPIGRSLHAFARVAAAPRHRNPVSFYVDAGLAWSGFALGVAHARGEGGALESVLEITYKAALSHMLSLQPDLQLVHSPATGIADAVVLGLRATLRF